MIEINTEKTEEKSPAERIASFLDQMEPMFPNPQAAAELRRLQEANTMLHQALAQPEQESGKCGCGANLYIDENGKPCSKALAKEKNGG